MKKTLYTVVLAAILSCATAALSAEIRVLASISVKDALGDLVPQFEKISGHTVKTSWGGITDITRRIAGGEVVDIVIIPGPDVDVLITEGMLNAGSRVDFVKSTIGVAIGPNAPRPDI